MTRDQAKENLMSIGIEEPTSEQITNYLNQLQGETKKYSDRAEKGKKDAELVEELQAKLDAIENQNLSDIEKANKDTEAANKKVAELENQMKTMQLKNSFAEKGILGEEADKLIESIGNGNFDVELLGQIIANKESAAANAKEQEIANNSTNPGGGKGGSNNDADEKSSAEIVAETVAKSLGGDSKASSDIVSSYM